MSGLTVYFTGGSRQANKGAAQLGEAWAKSHGYKCRRNEMRWTSDGERVRELVFKFTLSDFPEA